MWRQERNPDSSVLSDLRNRRAPRKIYRNNQKISEHHRDNSPSKRTGSANPRRTSAHRPRDRQGYNGSVRLVRRHISGNVPRNPWPHRALGERNKKENASSAPRKVRREKRLSDQDKSKACLPQHTGSFRCRLLDESIEGAYELSQFGKTVLAEFITFLEKTRKTLNESRTREVKND